MGDFIDLYKKSITPQVDDWGKQATQLGKEIDLLSTEIDKLEANKTPSPDDLKKINDLKNKRQAACEKMDQASKHLGQKLLSLPVPPKPPEPDLLKQLPDWLSKSIKQKGIPLGDDVTIVPDVSVDFKKMKLKSVGLTLKWKF